MPGRQTWPVPVGRTKTEEETKENHEKNIRIFHTRTKKEMAETVQQVLLRF
jgi:hypothetical protein